MKTRISVIRICCLLFTVGRASCDPPVSDVAQSVRADPVPSGAAPIANDSALRADKRNEEMLDRMQAAVEEVAELYGNPAFLQVFTNDAERATELKQRIRATQTTEDIGRELTGLEKKRDDLLNDIALKQREAARLAIKLSRQRAALDALASAIDQARKAVEDTAK